VELSLFNIIIVEDNNEPRQSLGDHLSQEGFRVFALEDGERMSEAINASKKKPRLFLFVLPSLLFYGLFTVLTVFTLII
jgi:DNA-binding response OmpR family regulator